MKLVSICAIALVAFLLLPAAHSQTVQSTNAKEKAARIEFANEFIREVEALYGLQETAKKELAEDKSAQAQLVTAIRVGTRTLFEMKKSVAILDRIFLDTRFDNFRTALIEISVDRASAVQEMIETDQKRF